MFNPIPGAFLIVYKRYQPIYAEWQKKIPNVEIVEGLQREKIEAIQKIPGGTMVRQMLHVTITLLLTIYYYR